ncbi:TBC1 domain family member 20 [Centruroides vittatus]|uniref:TBC1 domain family member 20 n=1 Tax=Centruroides vittatus TaxID=120091 RepID=UPI00351014AF
MKWLLDHYKKERKKAAIAKALKQDDFQALKMAAVGKWGLIDDDLRRKGWPKLLGVSLYETSPKPTQEETESHPYYNQVVMDVNRSLKRFPPSIAENQRLAMQDKLVALIMRILVKHPELHYYQGYHDICVTFLLVLGEEVSFVLLERLSVGRSATSAAEGRPGGHLRAFMDETMDNTTRILGYVYILVRKENPRLRKFLEDSEVGVMFGLSWLITWFGHVLNRYDEVVRLFDLFLCSHSWMPMYLTAAIVLYRENEILKQECDMASVHCLLSQFPDDLPIENLVNKSLRLFENYPPEELEKEEDDVKQLRCMLDMTERRKRSLGRRAYEKGPIGKVFRAYDILKMVLPDSNWTLSVVVATAVFFCAAIYQAYRN